MAMPLESNTLPTGGGISFASSYSRLKDLLAVQVNELSADTRKDVECRREVDGGEFGGSERSE